MQLPDLSTRLELNLSFTIRATSTLIANSPYLGMGGVNDNSNEIGAGYSGSSAGGNFNGPFIKFGQTSNYMTELYNRHDQDVFQIRRMVNGEWQAFVNLWHSGNFNPDNYLPLTGNKTITGSLTVANGFTSGIMKCQTGAYPQLQFEQTNTGVTSILFVHTNNAPDLSSGRSG